LDVIREIEDLSGLSRRRAAGAQSENRNGRQRQEYGNNQPDSLAWTRRIRPGRRG
jgi:hypothetical protein